MYSARIKGEPTTFGTSGMLYRSNKVMYDRATNTLWSQLRGEPIVGALVGSGIALDVLPVALTTWGEWLAEHPDTRVMSRRTGYYSPARYEREDDPRSIYFAYREDEETMFPVWRRDGRLPPKQQVLGLEAAGARKAYSIAALRDARVVNDTLGGVNVVVAASAESSDALAFARGNRRFSLPPDAPSSLPDTLVDDDGVEWRVTRDGLVSVGDPARRLEALQAGVVFWFGWHMTYPDSLLYGGQ